MAYARRGLGDAVSDAAVTNYRIALESLVNNIENNILPINRKRVGDWVTAARAAGIAEANNIISVLQPWNAWDQSTADLSAIVIPTEQIRVQNGGAPGDISKFQPTAPPPLPDIQQMLQAQGGALTGSNQYTAPVSPLPPPPPAEVAPIYKEVQVQTTAAGSTVVQAPNAPATTSQTPLTETMRSGGSSGTSASGGVVPGGAEGTDALEVAATSGKGNAWLLGLGAVALVLVLKRKKRAS